MVLSNRRLYVVVLLTLVAVLVALALPSASLALPAYTAATGQACGVCHVSAAGGGALTAVGQRFAAVPTHQANPAAAWQQISAPAQATPAATAAPSPTPRPATPPAAATAAPTTLPKTGDAGAALLILGAAGLAVAGWGLRRLGR